MNLEYIPLLPVQRELYQMPRGFARFNEYIRTLRDEATGELKLPLVAMNPMGKDHLLPFVERLLDMDADGEARQVAAQLQSILAAVPGDFRLSLVVSDDFLGGWTNRYANELIQRRQPFVHPLDYPPAVEQRDVHH
jgi:hypothetical protein